MPTYLTMPEAIMITGLSKQRIHKLFQDDKVRTKPHQEKLQRLYCLEDIQNHQDTATPGRPRKSK